MSHCVKHEQCPMCARIGKDRNGDNLAIYSDGSSYCFSCGYSENAKGFARIKNEQHIVPSKVIRLPSDCSQQIPRVGWDYLEQYELTQQDVNLNTIMWSEYWERLVFPYFDDTGCIAWQGRYLGKDKKAKWFSQGDLKSFVHVLGNRQSRIFVVTEDVLSAIKISKTGKVAASPLFGSHLSTQRILQLKYLCDILVVWLDFDKAKEAVKFAETANKLNLPTRVVITKQDPKEYKINTIESILMEKLHGFTNT